MGQMLGIAKYMDKPVYDPKVIASWKTCETVALGAGLQFDFRKFVAPHVMASFNSDRYGFLHDAAIPRVCLLESAMEAENRAQGGSFKQQCTTLSQVQAMQNISAQSWAGAAGTVSPVRTVDIAFGAIKSIRPNFPSESTKPKKMFKIIKDLLPVEIKTDIDQLDIDVKTEEDLRKFMNICLQRMEDKVVWALSARSEQEWSLDVLWRTFQQPFTETCQSCCDCPIYQCRRGVYFLGLCLHLQIWDLSLLSRSGQAGSRR